MSAPDKPAARASSYARAGVDLDRDDSFNERVKEIAKSTHRPELLAGVGGFAGLFKTPERYKDPVLVASTDGVGTKIKVAIQAGVHDSVVLCPS